MEHPELRVSFHPGEVRDERHYSVELNCMVPGEAADDLSGPFALEFDWDDPDSRALAAAQGETEDRYGRWLTRCFFRDPALRAKFAEARGKAHDHAALRLRLWLGSSTPRLHGVAWERLQDPDSGAPLSTDERIHLSRFLSGGRSPSLKMRPRDRLSALVAIANPRGLDNQRAGDRDLGPILPAEAARAESNLQSIGVDWLTGPGQASFERIVAALRDRREGYDILYLVCHGALIDGEPLLWLEDDTGGIDRVSGARLAAALRDMRDPPRLVVLASCESADAGGEARSNDRGEFAALAPRLADAGVPAVIAMQSDVRMDTAGRFFARFFGELLRDGQIDRAVAVARASVAACPDWWVPVLITRLRFGRIWAEHGTQPGFSGLRAVAEKLGTNSCTPIVGPDLATAWTGSPMRLAHRWAELFEFPMAPRESDSLPQVAQYLAYHRDRNFLTEQLSSYIREHVVRHFGDLAPAEATDRGRTRLNDVLARVWRRHVDSLRERATGSDAVLQDAHWQLARLPFPVYITTNRDGLLAEALREAGRKPEVEVCRWRVFEADFAGWPPSVFETDPHFRPSFERPLVFHAFGHMAWPETLVLTEDNFFDYLIGITRNEQWTHTSALGETGKAAIPAVVRTALSWRSLIFLGFRISDWEFRALFRRILAQEQSVWTASDELRRLYKHVAVQLDPATAGEYIEPEGAREYLTDYFGTRNVSLQWGTATEYVEALYAAWRALGSPKPGPEDLDKLR